MSTAVRLCDGAIVIVDVVEGVCPQVRFEKNKFTCMMNLVTSDLKIKCVLSHVTLTLIKMYSVIRLPTDKFAEKVYY